VSAVDGEQVLEQAVAAYCAALGDRLLGAYALGSLAHGGFSALVSDVDLGLILSDPLRADDAHLVQSVAGAEKRQGSELQARLSVFWGTPSTLRGEREGGRFPPLDRLDLLESGRLLAGRDEARRDLPRPSARELTLTGAEYALDFLAGVRSATAAPGDTLGSMHLATASAVEELRTPQLLAGRGVRRVTKLVLFPPRFLYTARTGRVGTNDAAVDGYLADRAAPSTELVGAARAWRTGPAFDVDAVAALLAEQIAPLYLYYIDDHVERLGALGRDDLADAFREWRRRLTDDPAAASSEDHDGPWGATKAMPA
jgi:hypothetical protein